MERTFYSEDELRSFAAEFTRELRAGDAVGLSGPLGAGKTTFVSAVVQALLGHDPTSSPTFTFRHRYAPLAAVPVPAPPPIDHLDLFRIGDPHELVELGLEEVFDGSSIVLVEWWRNAPSFLPPHRYEIDIDGSGDGPRRVVVRRPCGAEHPERPA